MKKKTTKKKATTPKTKKKATAKKKVNYVSMASLAKEMGVTYQTILYRLEKLGIKGRRVANEKGRKVISFTEKQASKIKNDTSLPFVKGMVELKSFAKKIKKTPAQIMYKMNKLKIEPKKMRRKNDSKPVLVIEKSQVSMLKKAF